MMDMYERLEGKALELPSDPEQREDAGVIAQDEVEASPVKDWPRK